MSTGLSITLYGSTVHLHTHATYNLWQSNTGLISSTELLPSITELPSLAPPDPSLHRGVIACTDHRHLYCKRDSAPARNNYRIWSCEAR